MTKKTWAAIAGLLLPLALLAAPATAVPAPDARLMTPHATWHRVHFHMNAYKEAGHGPHGAALGCHGTWSDDSGSCSGRGEALHDYPFNSYVLWDWHRHSTHCPPMPGRDHAVWTHELRIRSNATGWPSSHLCGWVDKHWGTFAITGGQIYTNAGWHDVRTTTSVVGDREHTHGGPLFVHLSHRTGGYVLGLRGWIHY
jgi:hypothetical protein